MKKFLFFALVLIAAIAGVKGLEETIAKNDLFEESISAVNQGEYEIAENGFMQLKEEEYPDYVTANTLLRYVRALRDWETGDDYTKLQTVEENIKYIPDDYIGTLGEEVHSFISKVKTEIPIIEARYNGEMEK